MKRYYVDTSVIGGYFDEEYSEWTRTFFSQIIDNNAYIVFSDINEIELRRAPARVRDLLDKIFPKENIILVNSNEKTEILANSYIETGAISPKSYRDAEHIAIASVHTVDVIASWNFKHMVNYDRIQNYNKINLRFGYPAIDIREPRSLLS